MNSQTLELANQQNYFLSEDRFLKQEWFESNGLGGYASSTVFDCNTRKYHGLFVAQIDHLNDRYSLVSKLQECVIVDEQKYYLDKTHYAPNSLVPDQSGFLEVDFKNHICPTWQYKNNFFTVQKELMFIKNSNKLLLKYSIKSKAIKKFTLELKPLLSFRNFHSLSKANTYACLDVYLKDDHYSCQPYETLPQLFFKGDRKIKFHHQPCWYYNFKYPEEIERGYEAEEDLINPGTISIDLEADSDFFLLISLEEESGDLAKLWHKENEKRFKASNKTFLNSLSTVFHDVQKSKLHRLLSRLNSMAQDFIIKTAENEYSVIAGYHWFNEWGRDTMISLPGLLIDTKHEDFFHSTIRRFLRYQKNGLVPNIIGKPPAYNSVDASLWIFWALQKFIHEKNDDSWFKKELWDDMKNIFINFSENKADTVKLDENGLIRSGTPTDSYSWMDACVDGRSVIPRHGYLVEINALWYNAVCFIEQYGSRYQDEIAVIAHSIKNKIQRSFINVFYDENLGYLGDYYVDHQLNKQLRPNQIFAVSLPSSPLNINIARSVVQQVTDKLLTPFGLRTLSPEDPGYRGVYQGDQKSRDRAYHNGTVWPWLTAHYAEACIKVSQDKAQTKEIFQNLLINFYEYLEENNFCSIHEIFDGDEPHHPRGCIAQAWSVAEIRRLVLMLI